MEIETSNAIFSHAPNLHFDSLFQDLFEMQSPFLLGEENDYSGRQKKSV